MMDHISFRKSNVQVVGLNRTLSGGNAVIQETSTGITWQWGLIRVECELDHDGVAHFAVVNDSDEDFRLSQVCIDWPATVFTPLLDARDYVQLYHSQDFMKLSGVRPIHRPSAWSNPAEPSGMMTVLSERCSGQAILLGALPPYEDCFVEIPILHEKVHRDGAIGFGFRLQVPRRLAKSSRVELAHLIVQLGPDSAQLLKRYARLMQERVPIVLRNKPRATGWNSWDYYAGAVTQEEVVIHADFARGNYGDRLKYIVIDEGYECQWGVWEAGWKFKDGLESLCKSIRQVGYEPGIWTAPLMVNVYTPLFRQHPDWFVGDAQGNVYLQNLSYGSMAQLDITHSEVADHLEMTFRQLRAAGFTYFKCDFTQLLLGASKFARDDITHAGMIRKLFEIIRGAIGDEAYLLACGAPYEAVIGVADAHRTTGDIHHYWSQIRQNIRSMLARWWMQGAVGNTDPDFAIIRCEATTDDKQLSRRLPLVPWNAGSNWTSGREMELEEAKTLLLACFVTGGDLFLGDSLPMLNALGHDLLKRVLEPAIGPGVPINLFEYDGDEVPIVIADGNDRKLIVVFNLTDDQRQAAIPSEYASAQGEWTEFWTEERLSANPLVDGLVLAPRSAQAWWLQD